MTGSGFTRYLDEEPEWWTEGLPDYSRAPGTMFLTQALHLSDAINYCHRHFPKKRVRTDEFRKDGQDSLYRLSAATLASIMSHFEIFQRSLFAGLIEISRLMPNFSMGRAVKSLTKQTRLEIDLESLGAYRGASAQVGRLIADNLSGWHNPTAVNCYFHSIVPSVELYSRKHRTFLEVLWQVRHSIVHTGGWLSVPDAQKVEELADYGGQPILLGRGAVASVVRRMHPLVKESVGRLEVASRALLARNLQEEEEQEVADLFAVRSSRKSWFRRSA